MTRGAVRCRRHIGPVHGAAISRNYSSALCPSFEGLKNKINKLVRFLNVL